MKPFIERHPLTMKMMDHLSLLSKGGTASYEHLRTILGCNPQEEGYGYVASARKILTRKGYVFRAAAGEGIHRLTDEEIARDKDRQKRIRGQGRRLLREKSNADISGLSAADQSRLTSDLAIVGTILHVTSFQYTEANVQKIVMQPSPLTPPPIGG